MRSAALTLLLASMAAPCVLGALLHLLTSDGQVLLAAVHAGIGWWLLPSGPLAVLSLLLGRRRIALCCGMVAMAHAAWVLPGNLPPLRTVEASHLFRVGSSNLLAVNPTPEKLAQELLALDPDLWCVQECTPAWAALLDSETIAARWPDRHFDPDESAFGMAMLSKTPLEDVRFVDLGGVPMGIARVDGLTVGCVHTEPPRSSFYTERWRAQLRLLADWAQTVEGPLLLLGDLNATRHHPSYQRLIARASLHDAHSEVGRASASSWPAPPYWDLIPWLRIDHVLLSEQLQAVTAREGQASGSDHRPLVVELALPGDLQR